MPAASEARKALGNLNLCNGRVRFQESGRETSQSALYGKSLSIIGNDDAMRACHPVGVELRHCVKTAACTKMSVLLILFLGTAAYG